MQRDMITSRWDRFRADSKREWKNLTDEEIDQVKGNVEKLVSLVQQKYDYTKDQAQQEVTRFMDNHDGKVVQIARRLPADVDSGVRQHPWAAVAAAIGLGIALGYLAKPGHTNTVEQLGE